MHFSLGRLGSLHDAHSRHPSLLHCCNNRLQLTVVADGILIMLAAHSGEDIPVFGLAGAVFLGIFALFVC
jgi:hypothetical protein